MICSLCYALNRAAFVVLTGQLPRIDSMKEVLRHMRISREKTAAHYRCSKAEKESVVKVMATSVVAFITEGMRTSGDTFHSSEVHCEGQGPQIQSCTLPSTVAAAMGNQQIRGQVSDQRSFYI